MTNPTEGVIIVNMESINKDTTEQVLDALLNKYTGDNQEDTMSQDTFSFMESWRKSDPRGFRTERRKAERRLKKLEKKQKGI